MPPEARKQTDRPWARFLQIFGPVLLIGGAGFLIAYQFVDPSPPRRLVMASGPEKGAYQRFAERYREILGRQGIDLEVRQTAGSSENLKLLEAEDGVSVAWVQSGLGTVGGASDGIISLASLCYEPLWMFYRKGLSITRVSDLRGHPLAIGEEGSGTRAIALLLLKDNGMELSPSESQALSGPEAAAALREGRIDAAFFVAALESPLIQELLRDGAVNLISCQRAAAYTRKYRFLSPLVLPEGVVDFEKNIPAQDVSLIAPAATLLARSDIHPALISLLLEAAAEVHGPGGIFEEHGEFPSAKLLQFPLSKEAQRYLRSGPPFLQKFFPFWIAVLIDRLKVMLIPIIALVIPLFKIIPPTYRWRVRSRIYCWYRDLRALECRLAATPSPEDSAAIRADLQRIKREVEQVSVPLSYADELYNLRLHIQLVEEKI